MAAPLWLIQCLTDVPAGEQWLGPREQRAYAQLRVEPRRIAWRLGRWTAKQAVSACLGPAPARVEVLAAPDGAPEAWLDGERLPVSVSLSHRGDRALAFVAPEPQVVGCDLELIEPRSAAFVSDWLSATERELASDSPEARRPLVVNLVWTAKEAAAKVTREGLRLDVRAAVVSLHGLSDADGSWRPLHVDWHDGTEPTTGWWRTEPSWVMAVAGQPPLATAPQPVRSGHELR